MLLGTFAVVIAAYLVGGIPFAYLLGRRFRGVDIRGLGSRNVGTVNAFRHLGWKIGIAVLLADTAKGVAVILVARFLGSADWVLFLAALASTLGHNWSPYLSFNGGKGVAVVMGMSFAMLPGMTAAAFPLVGVGFLLTRQIVWAFGAGFVGLNAMIVLSGQPAPVIATCLTLSAIVVLTHFYRSFPEIWRAVAARDLRRIGEIE
ncbi:MAG: glycerol-3-phosphate acyltransferase [Chloroflexi bacterium]|nr:glycerol-3-phosphate acyltransferase [Chloroflexota bacterium]